MKHEKPEVVQLGSALSSIRSQQNKGEAYQDAPNEGLATSAAYEADE
jgi:hypothetical protein